MRLWLHDVLLVLLVSSLQEDNTKRQPVQGIALAFAATPGKNEFGSTDRSEGMNQEQSEGQFDSDDAAGSSSSSVPLLPAVDPNNREDLPTLQFGETLRLDTLGPIILNSDGSTRRISNWDQLSQQEQTTTWRRIKKRNEERRNKLLREQKQYQTENVQQKEENEL